MRPALLGILLCAAAIAGGCRRTPEPPVPAHSPDGSAGTCAPLFSVAPPGPAPRDPPALCGPPRDPWRSGPRPAVRHVIVVSEDGLRPDALMTVLPPVHDEVMKRGAYSLSARTIRHASTLPSHAAMLSGFDEPAHGLSWNSWKPERGFIQVPTIFDAAGKAGHHAAAFVGKRKLAHIAHPGSVDVFSRPGFFCKKVANEAARYFVETRPELMFVHFSDPDERGHAVGWMSDPQLSAIKHTDRCLGALTEAVAAAGATADTLFIVSSDHGGHGRNHSGRRAEDRLIPWIAWGAGVKRGYRITGEVSTVDTAATVLWALGYPPPAGLQGRPITEAFDLPEGPAIVD